MYRQKGPVGIEEAQPGGKTSSGGDMHQTMRQKFPRYNFSMFLSRVLKRMRFSLDMSALSLVHDLPYFKKRSLFPKSPTSPLMMFFFPVLLFKPFLFLPLLPYTPAVLASPETSLSSILGRYLVLNSTITEHPASGKGTPESRPYESSNLPASHRTITLNVSGTNPGALPVICKLPPWQPETSSSSHGANSSLTEEKAKSGDLRFNCTDPEVIVQLQALPHLDFNWGFFIIVALK